MTAIVMAMWLWTAQIKFCHQAHQLAAGLATKTEAGGLLPDTTTTPTIHVMNTETDLDSVALDPDPVTTAIGATATTTHVGANQGHFTGLPDVISHVTEAPAPTATIMTHSTADIPIAGIPPEMTADLTIDPGKHHYKPAQGSSSSSHTASWKSKDRQHKQVTINDPPSDYYNSDDNNSDSDDDLN